MQFFADQIGVSVVRPYEQLERIQVAFVAIPNMNLVSVFKLQVQLIGYISRCAKTALQALKCDRNLFVCKIGETHFLIWVVMRVCIV